MPVSKPTELPADGGGRWPHTGFRSVRWGDMEVGYTVAPAVDCAPGYVGLPGDLCQCPHYGYVFRGRLRAIYRGTDWPDDVATAGDVYFFPAGHTLVYEKETECLEINPAAALEVLMNHFELMLSGGWPSPGHESSATEG
ncbi:cupin domain-containing protein [Candidatus Mycobacterium wuenschmannii]